MKIEIKNRFSDAVIFSGEFESTKDALSNAINSGADFSGADFSGANLSEANFSEANFSEANLSWANLSGANLSGANLSEANLSEANLSEANLSGATGLPEIEKIAIKDAICANVCATPKNLNMNDWHTCDTVHCIAGWATVLHPKGAELEQRFGTSAAAALIFNICEGYVPNFHSDNETAMRWLRGEIERN